MVLGPRLAQDPPGIIWVQQPENKISKSIYVSIACHRMLTVCTLWINAAGGKCTCTVRGDPGRGKSESPSAARNTSKLYCPVIVGWAETANCPAPWLSTRSGRAGPPLNGTNAPCTQRAVSTAQLKSTDHSLHALLIRAGLLVICMGAGRSPIIEAYKPLCSWSALLGWHSGLVLAGHPTCRPLQLSHVQRRQMLYSSAWIDLEAGHQIHSAMRPRAAHCPFHLVHGTHLKPD